MEAPKIKRYISRIIS